MKKALLELSSLKSIITLLTTLCVLYMFLTTSDCPKGLSYAWYYEIITLFGIKALKAFKEYRGGVSIDN